MAFVLSGAISKLGHPTFGGTVRRAGVHQAVHDYHANNGIGVTVHSLQQTSTRVIQQSPKIRLL